VDVPDVLGVGSPLEEVDEGGSGGSDVADTVVPAEECGACVYMPLVVADPVDTVGPAAGLLWLLLLVPPLVPPALLLLLLLVVVLLLLLVPLAGLLLELDDDLKEERRF
jgi:hypothetical protein